MEYVFFSTGSSHNAMHCIIIYIFDLNLCKTLAMPGICFKPKPSRVILNFEISIGGTLSSANAAKHSPNNGPNLKARPCPPANTIISGVLGSLSRTKYGSGVMEYGATYVDVLLPVPLILFLTQSSIIDNTYSEVMFEISSIKDVISEEIDREIESKKGYQDIIEAEKYISGKYL